MLEPLHPTAALKRRAAAIRAGRRTKLRTVFGDGRKRTNLWIEAIDGIGYVASWIDDEAHTAYRVRVNEDGTVTPERIGFRELLK